MSVKVEECVIMDAETVSQLSKGLHTAQEITTLEYEILSALQWKLHCPSKLTFVEYFLSLLPEDEAWAEPILHVYSSLQTDIVANYSFVPNMRQSTIALAAILNSLEFIGQNDFPIQKRMEYFQKIVCTFGIDINSQVIQATKAHLSLLLAAKAELTPLPKCKEGIDAAAIFGTTLDEKYETVSMAESTESISLDDDYCLDDW